MRELLILNLFSKDGWDLLTLKQLKLDRLFLAGTSQVSKQDLSLQLNTVSNTIQYYRICQK